MAGAVTPIGIQRIEKRLDAIIPHLDVADLVNRPKQLRSASLSRALAAYCVKLLADTDDVAAAGSVTDRFHDRGIDAIFYDQKSSRLFLVQAKWSTGIDWKDSGEFVDGVRKLVTAEWDSFKKNEKIYGRRNEIEIALKSAAKITLVTVHHGPNAAETTVLNRVTEIVRIIDGESGLAEAVHWHQSHLLDGLRHESEPPAVNAAIYLSNWGEIREPYHAVFGRVQGRAIAELWKANPQITHMNLRDYHRRSEVNLAIARTTRTEPHHFWYFNNGLTIICDSISPAIYGRLQQDVALFRLEGISLVNGAQTTGIVGDVFDSIPETEKDKLWIQLRAIAVKHCPDGFAKRVTQFTNLQNAISIQDFLSLDPVHARIATDFAVEKRRYAFRWGGDADPVDEQGCTLKEATVALACAHADPWFAVQAKREISELWDPDSSRYKEIFHAHLPATRIWNAVKLMRVVDRVVAFHEFDGTPKADMVSSHLQRIVLHIVFRDPSLAGWDTASDSNGLLCAAEVAAHRAYESVRKDIVQHHPSEYLASLSKNFEKCIGLAARILAPPSSPQTAEDSGLPGDQMNLRGEDGAFR